MTFISIVSGTYNRLHLLRKMVDSARASLPVGISLSFILVDGGSSDGTQDWCRSQPDVTLIEHGELLGAVKAFCDGCKAVHPSCRYVILANDDIMFRGDSILKALVYLEETPGCGAVAFADNRPAFGKQGYAVMGMSAMRGGQHITVNYAQVGMFRKELGDAALWWGDDDPEFTARTYAADNYLSSKIWGMGYSVDAVKDVQVDDLVYDDALRAINQTPDGVASHPDSEAYFRIYPQGAIIPEAPKGGHPKKNERLRILYAPVFDPGWQVQLEQKRGLRDALSEKYLVYELDFLAHGNRVYDAVADAVNNFKPHMMLSQIQAHEPFNEQVVRQIRALSPSMVWVNWNGDVAPGGLTDPKMLNLLRWIDLQLTVNADVLPVYAANQIPAAYWQIGYEDPPDWSLPDMPSYDIVFLANAYMEQRRVLEPVLRNTGYSVGLYGSGWESGQGFTLYDFAAGRALYRNAKIAIGDNQFNTSGFVSNRMFEAMSAGNCLYMQQIVTGLEELTGLVHGVHYIAWKDTADLLSKITYYLSHDEERQRIANVGTYFIREHHSFRARVAELFKFLMPLAKRRPREFLALRYRGTRTKPFGVLDYGEYTPGNLLRLPAEHARSLISEQSALWEIVESENE